MQGGFSHFDQSPLLDISGYITWSSHVLWFCKLQSTNLQNMPMKKTIRKYVQKFSSLQSSHKSTFWSVGKPYKIDSNDYIINNQWFIVTCIILHNFQNINLQTSLEKSVLCCFQIEASCLNHHNKPRKLI